MATKASESGYDVDSFDRERFVVVHPPSTLSENYIKTEAATEINNITITKSNYNVGQCPAWWPSCRI